MRVRVRCGLNSVPGAEIHSWADYYFGFLTLRRAVIAAFVDKRIKTDIKQEFPAAVEERIQPPPPPCATILRLK